jgi:crossover junction endodeoxyribonuclease RusA
MTITVYGIPAPQGSKRFVGHAKSGRGIMVESSAKVKPWREAVRSEACHAMTMASTSVPMLPIAGAVRVTMVFTLPRPKSAKKGAVPSKKPDLSKLVRGTEDALTDAGVWEDDARVIRITAEKHYPFTLKRGMACQPGCICIYCEHTNVLDRPGVVIVIEPL